MKNTQCSASLKVLRNCSKITNVVLSTETAAKEQARDVLIMLPESLDKLPVFM